MSEMKDHCVHNTYITWEQLQSYRLEDDFQSVSSIRYLLISSRFSAEKSCYRKNLPYDMHNDVYNILKSSYIIVLSFVPWRVILTNDKQHWMCFLMRERSYT